MVHKSAALFALVIAFSLVCAAQSVDEKNSQQAPVVVPGQRKLAHVIKCFPSVLVYL